MKTKLAVSSITTMILLALAFALSQGTINNSRDTIRELPPIEMEAITGTGVCKEHITIPARYEPSEGWGCNVGTNCVHPNSAPCGTDYTYYYQTVKCRGATPQNKQACGLEDTDDPEYTKHDCYCKDHWLPFGLGQDKCKNKQTDASSKAKKS